MLSRLKLTALDFRIRLALVITIVIAYMVLTRIIYAAYPAPEDFTTIEMLRTPLRIIAAFALWLLMSDVIFSQRPDMSTVRRPRFWVAMMFVAGAPLVTARWSGSAFDVLLISLATIPVGFYEEFLFRGICQNLLARRLGIVWSVILTTIVFTLFHVGASPDDLFNYTKIVLMSIVLGVVYFRTGSIMVVVILHAAADILETIPPLVDWSMPFVGTVSLLVALTLLAKWAERDAPPHLDQLR